MAYVQGLGREATLSTSDDITHASIILQTVENLLEIASNQPLHKVKEVFF